jgi:hypothetical protein
LLIGEEGGGGFSIEGREKGEECGRKEETRKLRVNRK